MIHKDSSSQAGLASFERIAVPMPTTAPVLSVVPLASSFLASDAVTAVPLAA